MYGAKEGFVVKIGVRSYKSVVFQSDCSKYIAELTGFPLLLSKITTEMCNGFSTKKRGLVV
ncbi:hypothetical protein J14TS2_12390 [Bacillus sp. J14TS2]|nr:hypothetical protein J14TS2_12390 [Bacillus sp. J14TS2]